MFLELISNLSEKFRNITLPSKKLETFLKKLERKKEDKWGFNPTISRFEGERANHYTVLDLL